MRDWRLETSAFEDLSLEETATNVQVDLTDKPKQARGEARGLSYREL